MKLKDNVLLQYSITTLLVISLASYFLGIVLVNRTIDLQINKHIDLYPEIINQEVNRYPEILSYFIGSDYANKPEPFNNFIQNLKSFGQVFRIKVWGKDAEVIWSDDRTIVGKKFSDNDAYFKAWSGDLQYEVAEPIKGENINEMDHQLVLEIYVPLLSESKVVGIIEIYESVDDLYIEIQAATRFIWIMVISTGTIIYVLLFTIFYRAHRRLSNMNKELEKNQEVTILSLAAVAETRDNETGDHLMRTKSYIEVLAHYMKHNQKYKTYLTASKIDIIVNSSPLHDIGKVGVPDQILLKPGKLTPVEFEEIKKHPTYGRDALQIAKDKLGSNSYLDIAREIAYTHHEKWDGSGYPNGIKEYEIPLPGRLMALADVYDALISKRVYKDAFSHDSAKSIILEGKGTHFDPEIVDAFIVVENQFIEIAKKFQD